MDVYLLACGALMVSGLIMNCVDRRMFLLTALVGAGFFSPIPDNNAEIFYASCIAVEITVAVLAFHLNRKAGIVIADICVLLVLAHIMGYALDGHLPFSPYHIIVKMLEASQLLACVVLSPVLVPILRNHDAKTT